MTFPDELENPDELARALRLALESTEEFEEDLLEAYTLGELDEAEYRALKAAMEESRSDLLGILAEDEGDEVVEDEGE